jgi:predicted MPP superfamily phosphohydrolase
VYALINYYLYIRGSQALSLPPALKTVYLVVYLAIALSFIAGRFLERYGVVSLGIPLNWIGSFWFGAMTYFFFIVVTVDFLRVINLWVHFFPSYITENPVIAKREMFLVVVAGVATLMAVGYVNALNIRLRTLDITIPKTVPDRKSLNIVMASDIHLGVIVGKKRFERMVDKINALKPDLVLFAGDILDEDVAPVLRANLGDALKNIHAPLGIYGCTGNHEYIGGVEKACAYLTEHGIQMLRDSSVLVDSAFYVVGREDYSAQRFAHVKRKELAELMRSVDKKYPVILMDHQPYHLDAAVAAGVDLQLSGHTHHGQFWPINLITDRIYELSYGYKKKGATNFYVSSGVGTWGPPIRLVAWPEIVNIRLKFGE